MEGIVNVTQPAPTRVDASVVVCTDNRAKLLRKTRASFVAQKVRGDLQWELVVVDNNSRDEAAGVVRDLATSHPKVRCCFEFEPGRSHAHNHGMSVARGEVIPFTDDDVFPEPGWVPRTVDGMTATQCDACGGYVAPIWERPPPAWLPDRFRGLLAVRAGRTDTFAIGPGDELPFGADMAFRCSVTKRFGLFDPIRGRKGYVLASGEDGELFERIRSSGDRIMFFGDAWARYAVETSRLDKRHFRRWRYETSRNLAESRGFQGRRRIGGASLYLDPQLLRAGGRALVAALRDPADKAFRKELIVWHFLGAIAGLWRSRNAPARPYAGGSARPR